MIRNETLVPHNVLTVVFPRLAESGVKMGREGGGGGGGEKRGRGHWGQGIPLNSATLSPCVTRCVIWSGSGVTQSTPLSTTFFFLGFPPPQAVEGR